MQAEDIITKDNITLGVAIIGAALGVFNTCRDWINSRVRVQLNVISVQDTNQSSDSFIKLNIRNRSGFPITITDVGVCLHDASDVVMGETKFFPRGNHLPIRMESRTECKTTLNPLHKLSEIKNVYACTADGSCIKKKIKAPSACRLGWSEA